MTETKLKSDHVHNRDDQWRYSNCWRINHMIGDILISTQLLVSHLVTTFLSAIITTFLEYTWRVSSNNKMSMLSCSIGFDYPSGQRERENMLILFLGTFKLTTQTIICKFSSIDGFSNSIIPLHTRKRIGSTRSVRSQVDPKGTPLQTKIKTCFMPITLYTNGKKLFWEF